MKYCFHYNNKNINLAKADELIFTYEENNPNLITKVQEIDEKIRIIIDICDFRGRMIWDILSGTVQAHPNSAVLISKKQLDYVPELRLRNIRWFFVEGCYTWDLLNECISYGVSDVYIIDELGFDIENVSYLCKKNNVNVRVYPNIAQTSARLLTLGDYTDFYIRPEDIRVYEPFVDVFEFFGSLNKEWVLYQIYSGEEWNGPLELLILNLSKVKQTRNDLIPNIFGHCRLSCKKKCSYDDCNMCNRCISSTNELAKRIEAERKVENGED